jgi:hypothetical protein
MPSLSGGPLTGVSTAKVPSQSTCRQGKSTGCVERSRDRVQPPCSARAPCPVLRSGAGTAGRRASMSVAVSAPLVAMLLRT